MEKKAEKMSSWSSRNSGRLSILARLSNKEGILANEEELKKLVDGLKNSTNNDRDVMMRELYCYHEKYLISLRCAARISGYGKSQICNNTVYKV